ncbi:MAG: SPOR domain-containing protein, partial [Bdellovibrionaceae bacterium]|nr:SPOR domain-containing protein [Pseudobdellovibrionaceae bacterium]
EGDKTGHGEQGNTHEAKSEMISDDEIKKLTDETLKKEEFVADDSAEKNATTKHDGHAVNHETPEVKKAATHESTHAEVAKSEKTHVESPKKTTEVKKEHAAPTVGHGQNSKNETSKGAEGHDEALAAAQAFLDGKAPEVKEEIKKETRLPSSLPKDVAQYAVGKFTVQVASYAEKVDAEKKSTKLKEMGYQTNIFTALVNGKTWYRVSFGLFATQEEALSEKAKFLEKNKTESALVQKIKN